ncbi:hypothetical protein Ddye_027234 [Dipteronia dyeriana]|uniref:Uncharacterized protein n=1 Tax=Dipteronia dyeriana TaxID=168575 RepID=A0AAD9TPM4_9ROSI|nr:hypothetical protein Ddye_027234 [Dipteronia dyeriana]
MEAKSEPLMRVPAAVSNPNPKPKAKDPNKREMNALDTETLWELDRFVTYYKKKIKRQALMSHREAPAVEKIEVAMEAKKLKKGDAAGNEDVETE